MGSLSSHEAAVALGRIRWHGASPSLMGRVLTVSARVQVFVQLPSPGSQSGTGDGVWLDADVIGISEDRLELRTSFARFVAEPSLACRWPLDAAPLTRRELERIFAESAADVSHELASLVDRFQDDPQLRRSPLEQLLAYAASVRDCASKVQAIATLIESVSHDLSAHADRSMLVVAQSPRALESNGAKRF